MKLYISLFLLIVVSGAFRLSRPPSTYLGSGYLIITFKNNKCLKSTSPGFKQAIDEKATTYDSIQKKYYQLTNTNLPDTLTGREYNLVIQALKFPGQPPKKLHCAFSLEKTAIFYEAIKKVNTTSNITTPVQFDNLEMAFTTSVNSYSTDIVTQAKTKLKAIADVQFVSALQVQDINTERRINCTLTNDSARTNDSVRCDTNTTEIEEVGYQKLMRIKNTIWADSTGDYGRYANVFLVESNGVGSFTHCELAHRSCELNEKVIRLDGEGTDEHPYHSVGTLLGDHHKRGQYDCIGIVPKVGIRGIITYKANTSIPTRDILLTAFSKTQRGDIVLLPFTKGDRKPLDNDVLIRKLTSIATVCLGIIVVEAAGNQNSTGKEILDIPDSSPAIIVGATMLADNGVYQVNSYSNYGQRIDCFVPGGCAGDSIVVPKAGKGYVLYSNTSAASAIMAGVLAGLQSRYYQRHQRYFTASQIRQAIKKCNARNYGQQVADNGIRKAYAKRIPYANTLWSFLQSI